MNGVAFYGIAGMLVGIALWLMLLPAAAGWRRWARDRELTGEQREALDELGRARSRAIAAVVTDYPRLHPELSGDALREAMRNQIAELEEHFAARALHIREGKTKP